MTITEKEWYIEAPWGRISIIAWGHCYNPPVLLCHGVKDSAVSFRPLIHLLPTDFYYIGIDLPGCGKSDPFPPGLLMSFYDLVYCVEVVAKHHRWSNFAFLGHSAGAGIGMLYTLCYPDKVTKLIQLDPITPPVKAEFFNNWYKRSYQAFFDKFDYYNSTDDKRPAYTREEALNKIMKAVGVSEEQAAVTLERVSEDAGAGLVRFTFDQRYRIVAIPMFTPEQSKGLLLKSKTLILVVPTEESVKKGMYSAMPFVLDDSGSERNHRVRRVEGHHNVHISNPDRVSGIVGQFMLHGPEGLDVKARL